MSMPDEWGWMFERDIEDIISSQRVRRVEYYGDGVIRVHVFGGDDLYPADVERYFRLTEVKRDWKEIE